MSQKTVHLLVSHSLCRRLIPLVCAMRYCRDINYQLIVYCKSKDNLNVFFQIPPNLSLKPWTPETFDLLTEQPDTQVILDEQSLDIEFLPKNFMGKTIYPDNWINDMNKPLIIPKKADLHKSNNLVINYIHRQFGYGTDVVGIMRNLHDQNQMKPDPKPNPKFKKHSISYSISLLSKKQKQPQTRPQIWKKTEFELQLHQYTQQLRPIPLLNRLIEYHKKRIFKQNNSQISFQNLKVGFHFRNPTAQTARIFIQYYLPQYQNWTIFICSDDLVFQNYLCSQYPQIKAYSEPAKVKQDIAGIQRSLIDLYLLADCDHIIGMYDSAFSYYAWLLSSPETHFEFFNTHTPGHNPNQAFRFAGRI